jgi:fermentation-respiration switch protein FrsA (DUF1100 family)
VTSGRLLTALLLAVLAMVVVLALVWSLQHRLVYFPGPQPPPATAVLPGTREVVFPTEDGLRLQGWFVPARARTGRPGAAVLVLPGNAGNRAHRAPLASAMAEAGMPVLLLDYRGYGGNPGRPTEAGLAADARAARLWLAAHPEVDPRRLVYFGESLGAAVALRLALDAPPAALVLRSPFTSLADVGRRHYPYLPVGLLLRERYESIRLISRLTAPLLVVAGEHDRIVPAAHSRRLHEAARGPKRLVLIPGADHNDVALLAGERLISEMLRFLADRVPPDPAS